MDDPGCLFVVYAVSDPEFHTVPIVIVGMQESDIVVITQIWHGRIAMLVWLCTLACVQQVLEYATAEKTCVRYLVVRSRVSCVYFFGIYILNTESVSDHPSGCQCPGR
jgi:hypothetical protein